MNLETELIENFENKNIQEFTSTYMLIEQFIRLELNKENFSSISSLKNRIMSQ